MKTSLVGVAIVATAFAAAAILHTQERHRLRDGLASTNIDLLRARAAIAPLPNSHPMRRAIDTNIEKLQDDDSLNTDLQPVSRLFSNSDQALQAVKKGAAGSDDTLIRQFEQPGPDCTWCTQFYSDLRSVLKEANLSADQTGYYGQILSTSGRPENVKALLDLLAQSKDPAKTAALSEAVEVSEGGPEVFSVLANDLQSPDLQVQQASVSALTNQSNEQAAQALYEHASQAHGDPASEAAIGIGLSAMVPNEEAIPYLQQIASQHDTYSYMAVDALLNAGLPGVQRVLDTLSATTDETAQRALLKDALDHVLADKDTEEFLQAHQNDSSSPAVREFEQQILDKFESESVDEAADGMDNTDNENS